MNREDLDRFKNITFEGFKALAQDDSLTPYEKIGFPNSYRQDKEEIIFRDITNKLGNLNKRNKVVFDIGSGCSGLPLMLIELCRKKGHTLVLIDSADMLRHLPDASHIVKVPCRYPECESLIADYAKRVDAILTYSVLHYVFAESNLFNFLDTSLGLLADQGQMLIGDIPNISKRKRFFNSLAGVRFHQEFTGTRESPPVTFNNIETRQIDDAVLFSVLLRCRSSGFDAYLLPQPDDLPMANRREDLLIVRP
ncbi:MAG: SAM-dependent methyltransferase [Nitrospirae bacterium]|nr:SAM-dependent methyltransferase [Nitrospirota bacterium]